VSFTIRANSSWRPGASGRFFYQTAQRNNTGETPAPQNLNGGSLG